MTPREALEILYKRIAPNPTKNNECIELCKEALEKQIPKKVVLKNGVNLLRGKCYSCPNCDWFFGYQYESKIEEIYANYCPDCGQALDWEDF